LMLRGKTIFVFAGLLVFASSSAGADEACANLITTRCEVCHYMTRICESLGKKSKSSWKRTVGNMVLYGAQLNKDEQQELVDCLSGPSAAITDLCRK